MSERARLTIVLWFEEHGFDYLAALFWHRCSDCSGWRIYRRIFFLRRH